MNGRKCNVKMKQSGKIIILPLSAIVAAGLVSSCTRETGGQEFLEELVEMSFSAMSGGATSKSGFDGMDVVWHAGDEMSIFDGSLRNRRFSAAEGGTSAVFTGRAKESGTYYALYPYMSSSAMTEDGIVETIIPARQRAVSGGWADSVNVSAGKISGGLDGGRITMKNVCGYVKIIIPDSIGNLVALSLRSRGGEALAGRMRLTLTGDIPQCAPAESGTYSSVVLVSPDGVFRPGTYYMVVAPTALAGGLELSVRRSDDRTATLCCNAGEVVRNSASTTSFILEPATLTWEEPAVENITVNFLTESLGINQPFTENMSAVGNPSSERVSKAFYLKEGGYEFYFNATYLNINSTMGLRMGQAGDYVLLPAVQGKRLTQVSMEWGLNSVTASYTAGIYTNDDVPVPVAGGEVLDTGTESQGKVLTWTLTGADEGVRYRLRRGTGSTNFRIRTLTLQYSGHDVAEVRSVHVTDATMEDGAGTVKGDIEAVHADAGVITWGVEYRREGASAWTSGPSGEGTTIEATLTGLEKDTYYVRLWAKADAMTAVYSEEVKLLDTAPLVVSLTPFDKTYWSWLGNGSLTLPMADAKKQTSATQGEWDYWLVRGQYTSGFYPWNLNGKSPLYAFYYWGDENGCLHISSRGLLLLPAIEQHRLVEVSLTSTQSSAVEVSVCGSTTSIKINGEDIRATTSAGTPAVWDLTTLASPTAAGTPYYLAHNSNNVELVISDLTLTYEPAL